MSLKKIFVAAAMAIAFALPCKAELSLNNGISAGKALLSLYSQYKADGKLDLANANNIANITSLVTNIQGLTSKSNTGNFLSGLISGSKNLVNTKNQNSVLSTLTSIAGLDANSIATSVASSATSSLLSKLGSSSSSSSSNGAASVAANALSSLFKGL